VVEEESSLQEVGTLLFILVTDLFTVTRMVPTFVSAFFFIEVYSHGGL